MRIPGLQSGAADGSILTYNATNGNITLVASSAPETGTFTPYFSVNGASGNLDILPSNKYSNRSGFYSKVGKMVTVTIFVSSNQAGSSNFQNLGSGSLSDALLVRGLPFRRAGDADLDGGACIHGDANGSSSNQYTMLVSSTNSNSDMYLTLQKKGNYGNENISVTDSIVQQYANGSVSISFSYKSV